MITNKEDRILNIPTIDRILKRNSVAVKYKNLRSYYYTIKSNTRTGQFYIHPNSGYLSKLDDIISDMESLFTKDVQFDGKNIVVYKELPKTQPVRMALVLKHNSNTIKFVFYNVEKGIKMKDKLPCWKINELIFPAMINEAIDDIKDELQDISHIISPNYSPKLTLKVYSSNNNNITEIKYIKSAEHAGDERVDNLQIKQDVELLTTIKKVNISIKKNNHKEWSSANRYLGGVEILKTITNPKSPIVQYISKPNGASEFVYNNATYSALAFPATRGEVKKFCFDDNTIHYIIINDFGASDIDTSYERYGKNLNDWSVNMRVDLLYPNTEIGINAILPNVFLEIYSGAKSSTIMTTAGFRGVSMRFVPKDKIRSTTAIIDKLPASIPSRL